MNSVAGVRPRLVFLHYTAPPVVGGVEAVIAEHVHLFRDAGYRTLIVAGRAAEEAGDSLGDILVLPEIDSENPGYLKIHKNLEEGTIPPYFLELQASIEGQIQQVLEADDVVIAHNVLTTHYNLALTAAIHGLVSKGILTRLIVWCHDISRHVNPARNVPHYHGQPWDLLRVRIPGAAYVAVSAARQRTLAGILGCPPDAIRVIRNGVNPAQLLGLTEVGEDLAASYGLFDADLVILMPVRITRIKNLEFAFHVIAALKRVGLQVRLVITGPPDPHVEQMRDYGDALRSLRRELSLEEEAIFVYDGTQKYPPPFLIDGSVVSELYRISDLILMPSHREGFGMPVFEAAFLGRPVFATHIPATEELPGFRYFIERDESPDSVADRIRGWAEADSTHILRTAIRREYTWSSIFTKKILPLVIEMASRDPGRQP